VTGRGDRQPCWRAYRAAGDLDSDDTADEERTWVTGAANEGGIILGSVDVVVCLREGDPKVGVKQRRLPLSS
jgi:hypothetical protein